MSDQSTSVSSAPAKSRHEKASKSGNRPGKVARRVQKSKCIRLSRVRRYLRLHSRSRAISTMAVLACATTIELVLEEIFRLAKRVARLANKGKISNRHIYLAIQSTDWLRELFNKSIIPSSGVAPSLPLPSAKRPVPSSAPQPKQAPTQNGPSTSGSSSQPSSASAGAN